MPSLREFCPKCGTPTDPGLRESHLRRGGERPVEELKRNRKTVLIACAGIAAVLVVGGRLSWPDIPLHISTHAPRKGPVVTDAEQIYRAYHEDPDAAAKRFKGREMVVSGEFLRIVPDGYGSIDMRLKTSNPDSPLGADLADEAVADAKQLRPGQQVTVSCRGMAGSGDDRWLQNCAIQPVGGGSAAPAPPAFPSPTAPPPATGQGNSG
ncbi:MAG: hypothetical protein ABI770_05890 [Sphingomicrobium sp.]